MEEETQEETKQNNVQSGSPIKLSEESEALKRQKELILLQMQQQQEMILSKKEEATKAAAERELIGDTTNKLNVLDIKVEEDFEIDDIWSTIFKPCYPSYS